MDLASALIRAIEEQREQLEAEAQPLIGRVPFHVNIDINVKMQRVVISTEPCRKADCAA